MDLEPGRNTLGNGQRVRYPEELLLHIIRILEKLGITNGITGYIWAPDSKGGKNILAIWPRLVTKGKII